MKYGRPGVKIDRVEAEEWQRRLAAKGPKSLEWLKEGAITTIIPPVSIAWGSAFMMD